MGVLVASGLVLLVIVVLLKLLDPYASRRVRRTDRGGRFELPTPTVVISAHVESAGPVQRGHVVFAQPESAGLIGLDCLLADARTESCDAHPVHIVAALPSNPWLAAVEQDLLQDWLTLGDPVSVEISGSLPLRVRVASHRTTLVLPLQGG